jgi:hypothetical protein
MAQLFKGHLKNHALFAIEEKGTKFGLGSGCNNESKYGTQGKECAIQLNGNAVLCCPSHEKFPHALLSALAPDVHDHV